MCVVLDAVRAAASYLVRRHTAGNTTSFGEVAIYRSLLFRQTDALHHRKANVVRASKCGVASLRIYFAKS